MSNMFRRCTSVLALACLAACGGGSSSSDQAPAPTKADTVQKALQQLEAAGNTPALDRSASVTGVDANSNGVRDDVEQYVASLGDTPTQKSSLLSLSKAMGTALAANLTDQAALRAATDQMNNAVACIWKTYPANVADQKVLEMRKVTVNTRARYDAYMHYNAAVAGTVVTLPREVNCA